MSNAKDVALSDPIVIAYNSGFRKGEVAREAGGGIYSLDVPLDVEKALEEAFDSVEATAAAEAFTDGYIDALCGNNPLTPVQIDAQYG